MSNRNKLLKLDYEITNFTGKCTGKYHLSGFTPVYFSNFLCMGQNETLTLAVSMVRDTDTAVSHIKRQILPGQIA